MSLRAEAGPRPHPRGQLPLGDLPAARTPLRLRHVLGDLRLRRRQDVSDLVTARRENLLGRQPRPALAAFRGRVPEPALRVIHELHRRARLARLLPRSALAFLPQRPVARLLLKRAIGRRRPRRGRRIPGQPFLQPLHPGAQLADQPVRLRQPRSQFLTRQGSKLLRRRQARLIGHSTQPCHSAPRAPVRNTEPQPPRNQQ